MIPVQDFNIKFDNENWVFMLYLLISVTFFILMYHCDKKSSLGLLWKQSFEKGMILDMLLVLTTSPDVTFHLSKGNLKAQIKIKTQSTSLPFSWTTLVYSWKKKILPIVLIITRSLEISVSCSFINKHDLWNKPDFK